MAEEIPLPSSGGPRKKSILRQTFILIIATTTTAYNHFTLDIFCFNSPVLYELARSHQCLEAVEEVAVVEEAADEVVDQMCLGIRVKNRMRDLQSYFLCVYPQYLLAK